MGRAGRMAMLTALGVTLAGCGGSARTVTVIQTTTVAERPKAPPPPLARVVPAGYRTLHLYRANLSGSEIPEAIVTSTGPPTGSLGFHPADLQVLSWDEIARRWTVIFDAEKVQMPDSYAAGGPQSSNSGPGYDASSASYPATTTSLLDPKADVQIEQVAFASLLPGTRKQLVFSSLSSLGGSGTESTLTVLNVTPTDVRIIYSWAGEGLDKWQITGKQIKADAWYWTRADAHCCPSRTYRFAVAQSTDGYLAETFDQRPYLGVRVEELGSSGSVTTPLQVEDVDPRSSAYGKLRRGDVIEDVLNAPRPNKGTQEPAASSVYVGLSDLDAGQVARLKVLRSGSTVTVLVKLGSLADESAASLIIPANDYSAAAL